MRQVVPDVSSLAERLRTELATNEVAARATGFGLISSADRSYGTLIGGVEPLFEQKVSSLPGLVKEGRYLEGPTSEEMVIGSVLARNLRVSVGD
jgi:ABC-type lipoprotein release transport system permease subunit